MGRENTKGTSRLVRLTEAVIESADPLPPAKPGAPPRRAILLDTQLTGFGVAINAASKSYFVVKHVAGRQVRSVFRRVGEGTVAEARRAAAKLLVRMADGVDLIVEKRAQAADAARTRAIGISLRAALELREGALRAKGRSERTITGDRYVIEKYLAGWLDRELVSLDRAEVRKRHAAIASAIAHGRYKGDKWRQRGPESGRATANRTMRAFRAVWLRAAKQHPEIGLPPTLNIDWFAEAPKKAPIGTEGLAALYPKIRAIKNGVRRDVWLTMLFTGLRRESATTMRWEHLDLDSGTLFIPNPKGGPSKAFTLPLSAHLTEILRARAAEHAQSFVDDKKAAPWVFPSLDAASGHIEEPREDDLGITPHDARRLFATVAESVDASPYSIKALLNHALPRGDITSAYLNLEPERLRVVMEAVATKMLALCEGKPAPSGDKQAEPTSEPAPAASAQIITLPTKAKRKAAGASRA